MDVYASFVGFFQEGGPFMYPIAIVLAIGLAIALERFFYLAFQMRINRTDFERILPLVKQRKVRELVQVTNGSKSAGECARIDGDRFDDANSGDCGGFDSAQMGAEIPVNGRHPHN
jgi:hypothetical protein